MPPSKRYLHASFAGFMTLLFAGLAIFNIRFLFTAAVPGAGRPTRIVSALFIVLSAVVIWLQIWWRNRVVREFSYQDSTLRFRTLGISRQRERARKELEEVRDWRGRGGQLGYRLIFRDGSHLYLELSVSHAEELARELRA